MTQETQETELWIEVLRTEVQRASQRKVGNRIGYSPTTISQVLSGSYAGDVDKVRASIEGAFMGVKVDCPAVGEIPRDRCQQYQSQKFASTNPLRVQLSMLCPECTHNTHNTRRKS